MRVAVYITENGEDIDFYTDTNGNLIIDAKGNENMTFSQEDLLNMIHDLQRFYNEIKSKEIKENSIKKAPKHN